MPRSAQKITCAAQSWAIRTWLTGINSRVEKPVRLLPMGGPGPTGCPPAVDRDSAKSSPPATGIYGQTRRYPASGTDNAISQLKDFNWEIGMDTPAQFRKHAADCETMSKVSRDPETKVCLETNGGEMAAVR
jgi:hypothetical protein